MALPLHKDCRARILDVLTDGIGTAVVRKGMFLEYHSLGAAIQADAALPKTGSLPALLEKYVGEYPLLNFISSILATELIELDKFNSNAPTLQLSEIEGYEDSRALSERLLSLFESLPWKYTFSYPLPSHIGDIFKQISTNIQISEKLRFVLSNEEFARDFPASHDNPKCHQRIFGRGLLSHLPKTWNNDTVYFQFETNGYVSLYGETTPLTEALRFLKAVFGLGIALRLFDFRSEYTPPVESHMFVHRHFDGAWNLDNRFSLNDTETQLINSLCVVSPNGKANSEEIQVRLANHGLNELSTILNIGKKAELILLAAEWLFESYVGTDELLHFVRSMVALEIILGNGDQEEEISTGVLLRNRCAYLIGTTHSQREEILRDFANIYRVRSQIVHRGKRGLSADERTQLSKLRWMCRRVIRREFELLKAEHAKKA
jgi:hypothetical protein